MDRRKFIKSSTAIAAMVSTGSPTLASLPTAVRAELKGERKNVVQNVDVKRKVDPYGSLQIQSIEIKAGATKPFEALHVSDTHVTNVDARNDDRKIQLASKRYAAFPKANYYWYESIRYARDNNLLMLHSGDFADFVSEAILDVAAASFKELDCLVSAGNHEYSQYVGEAKEDEAYKAQSYAKVQEAYPNDLKCSSRVVNGVNLVSFDNIYYYVTPEVSASVRQEFTKGYPVVLLCHVPFYTPALCQHVLHDNGGVAGYVMGAPLDITSTYKHDDSLPTEMQWKNRSVQQFTDAVTSEFVEWLRRQPLLKGILCGHCHLFWQERFSDTAMQYVVDAGFRGQAYRVKFV